MVYTDAHTMYACMYQYMQTDFGTRHMHQYIHTECGTRPMYLHTVCGMRPEYKYIHSVWYASYVSVRTQCVVCVL